MKILHICLGGVYTDNWGYQDNLLPKELQTKSVDNTVITTTSSFDGKYNAIKQKISYYLDGVKIIRIPASKNRFRQFFYYYNIYKDICLEKPDCIFVHGVQTCSGIFAVKYKQKVNRECVLFSDNHAIYVNSPLKNGLAHRILYWIRNRVVKKCCRNYDAIWGVTPECIDYFEHVFKISPDGIGLLPLGHSISDLEFRNSSKIRLRLRKKHRINPEDIVLITGGKLSDEKKVIETIKAFQMLNKHNSYLFVFGRIEKDYENELTSALLGTERVLMLGELSVEEYVGYYFASDIAVFPGGQSVLWQQAIGCGLPLILDKRQNVDYLDVGGNVCFSNDDSPESIYLAINECLRNEKYKVMSKVANTKGREYFSYSRIAEIIIDTYHRCKNEN